MLLSLLLACPNAGAPSSGGSGEAWPDWAPAAATDDTATSPIDTADMPEEQTSEYECDPVGCIELAEAVDRGFSTISYGTYDIQVTNIGDWPICIDGWYTFLSDTSQDAVAGTTGHDELEPGDTAYFPYAEWGDDAPAWWCIEHNQYTAAGALYTFEGERAPTRIANWANNATDEDGDASEDHTDYDPTDGLPQTQHNHWDYLAARDVFIVGRHMNWYEVGGLQSVQVTVVVTNLGRRAGTATVTETLPEGWVASSFSPAVSGNVTTDAGVTTLSWPVALEAAVEPANEYSPTWYDVAELSYILTYTGECHGREIGFSPQVTWTDNVGSTWTSAGSPLVLQCCNSDDSITPGNGGFGP